MQGKRGLGKGKTAEHQINKELFTKHQRAHQIITYIEEGVNSILILKHYTAGSIGAPKILLPDISNDVDGGRIDSVTHKQTLEK